MAEKIFDEFGVTFDVELIPSTGGVFEITVDGEPVYSKKASGRHAEYDSDVAPHLRG